MFPPCARWPSSPLCRSVRCSQAKRLSGMGRGVRIGGSDALAVVHFREGLVGRNGHPSGAREPPGAAREPPVVEGIERLAMGTARQVQRIGEIHAFSGWYQGRSSSRLLMASATSKSANRRSPGRSQRKRP